MPKKIPTARRFKGDLFNPIDPEKAIGEPPVQMFFENENDVLDYKAEVAAYQERYRKFVGQEIRRKMALLFQEYQIAHDDFPGLARGLIKDFVPGLSVKTKKVGRKTQWTLAHFTKFYADVERCKTKQDRNKTLGSICKAVSRSDPWKTIISSKATQKSLLNLHAKAEQSAIVKAWIAGGSKKKDFEVLFGWADRIIEFLHSNKHSS